jgi:hypothetical protein
MLGCGECAERTLSRRGTADLPLGGRWLRAVGGGWGERWGSVITSAREAVDRGKVAVFSINYQPKTINSPRSIVVAGEDVLA